jgi:glucan phosphoethanolaminetransferase (alkaline phosphatase superfamily)
MPDLERRHAWAGWTIAAALAATAFDAVLLQQKKAFFTGGFLASVYTRTWTEAFGFLIASFLLDVALLSALVLVARRLTARLRLTPLARVITVMGLASAPMIVMTFVAYRLLAYLGSAFDLSLMFDLTGGKPQEILAVSAKHLIAPALLIGACGAVAIGLVWTLNRVSPGSREPEPPPRRPWRAAAAALIAGVAIATVAAFVSEAAEDGLPRTASGRIFGTLAKYATDVDRDGYGALGRLRDPAPFDADVHPYATERPGDGIDQNGVGGDLPADGAQYVEGARSASVWQTKPDIVFVVLESFRADTPGRIVDGVSVTPTLDALAREGVSARYGYSHNGYTAQSRFHLFSGSLAGLRQGRTLIDDFKSNGYEVAYFSGQDESFGAAEYGIGFERADVAYDARQDRKHRYSTFTTAGSLAVPASIVVERVRQFLERRSNDRPLFLYVNFHDTHYPYHHDGVASLVKAPVLKEADISPANEHAVKQMYLNTAATVDRAVGDTVSAVEQRTGRRPAVIVTADHGESLFDEGFLGHGYALNDVQTRIPLIVRGLPVAIEQPFGQADLRDAIGAALARADLAEPPRVVANAEKAVFQYLGTIERPRQIALKSASSMLVYDFRSGSARFGDGAWTRPASLPPDQADRVAELVHRWERMIVARSSNEH